jgi:hypothetical protein
MAALPGARCRSTTGLAGYGLEGNGTVSANTLMSTCTAWTSVVLAFKVARLVNRVGPIFPAKVLVPIDPSPS